MSMVVPGSASAQAAVVASQNNFVVGHSLRLAASNSSYLSFTPGTTTNRDKLTFSVWIKRLSTGGTNGIFGAGTDNASNRTEFWFGSLDLLYYVEDGTLLRTSTAAFSSTTTWGHFLVSVDNGNSTAADRIIFESGGTRLTTTGIGDPGSTQWNLSGTAMKIGVRTNPPTSEFGDIQIAEVNFIDGQQLDSSYFGQTVNSVWSPKLYTGSYGTNGAYLNFSDGSSNTASTIGKDYSGNGNNWTPVNIVIANDWSTDVPP